MNDIADVLGRWAAGLSLAAVPPAAQQQALRCITDVVGVTLAGSTTHWPGACAITSPASTPREPAG
ncbi:MAG: hypothetical protein IPI73_21595 [Betaproteobacteria bacterium]|nr:hypothetical protein [Betaproteobacteria bacterium]